MGVEPDEGIFAIQVDAAVRALTEHDADVAAAVEERDAEVDRREVELEEELSSVRKKMLAMRRGDPPPPSQEAIRW